MTAEELGQRLAALGLTLDDTALAAALRGAQDLKAGSGRLAAWLARE